jgi:hypothetical protein
MSPRKGWLVRRAIVILLVLGACSSSGWSDAEKNAFQKSCEQASGGKTAICACALEKAQAAEDSPEDLTQAQTLDIAKQCRDAS